MIRTPRVSVETVARLGRRFEFVDALRGLAAILIVLPHAVGLFVYSHESWLSRLFLRLANYGRSSVEVFFVVSGFAIAYSLRGAAGESFSLWRFMLRRAVRLDPPYWVAILWNGLVVTIHARAAHQPIVPPSLGKVLAHIFYLQDILGLGNFNVVFWTLCLEFQLYLVFAVMMRLGSAVGNIRREWRFWGETDQFGWLMVSAFCVSLVLSHTVLLLRPGWFVPFFYLFLSGSLAAWRCLNRISDRLFQLCLLAMALGLLFRPELERVLGFLTAIVIYAAIRRAALHRWLAERPAQWLGRMSYSIYLLHAPAAVFFLGLRTRVNAESHAISLICLAGTYLFTFALAALLHHWVEVPCLRLAQRLKRPPSFEGSQAQQAPPA